MSEGPAAHQSPQLLYDILERIVCLAPDAALIVLCRVSRDLRFLAEQELYRVLDFRRGLSEVTVACLETIEGATRLGKYVRLLKLSSNLRYYAQRAAPLTGLVANVLELMPHLRVLSLPHLDLITSSEPRVLEIIAGIPTLTDINISWHPTLAPLLMNLKPLRYLEFDAGSGLNNHFNNVPLEHLLDVCAPTLEDLRLTGYGLAQYLLTRPELVFPVCEELRLLFCDPLEVNIARAFPSVRRLEIFPNQVQPLELLTDPDNFPQLELATLGVALSGYTAQKQGKGRMVSHLALFSSAEKLTHEGILSLVGLLQAEKLLSIQLAQNYHTKETSTLMAKIFVICPSLQFFTAQLTVRDLPQLFSTILSTGSHTLKSVSLRCPMGDVISLDPVYELIRPSLNALRTRCPDLTLIEVRRSEQLSPEPDLQIRLAPWDRGELRWFKRTGRQLPAHPGFAFRY